MTVFDYLGTSLNSAKNLIGTNVNPVYDINGNEIYFYQPRSLNLLFSTTNPTGQSPQGMAVYGDYIFQFFSTADILKVLRKDDFSIITEMPCSVMGHCNSLEFGPVEQENGFPLLYVSDSGENSYDLFIVSADLNQVSLVDTINMPTDVGHYTNATYDFENRKIYTLGYHTHPRTETDNDLILCTLDMDHPSTVLSSMNIPYLGVQNSMFWDGEHIVVNMNTWDGLDFKVCYIDPVTGNVDDMYEYSKEYDSEFQGMSWQGDWILVSKWAYKTINGTKTLFREYYRLQLH